MPATTRGPLPPGVYWRRRLFVGLLALSIVFIVASALGAGSDGSSDEDPVAQQAGADPTTTAPTGATGPTGPTTPPAASPGEDTNQQKQLAEPSGTCAPADIHVVPWTKKAVAGQDIELTLRLRTRTTPACHWKVDKRSLAVRITGDDGEIWSTRHCAEGIPSRAVVLRSNAATTVTVTWDARESDEGCPKATDWVLPGEYVVAAAALGGEPVQRPLALVAPEAPEPEPEHTATHRTGNALERVAKRDR